MQFMMGSYYGLLNLIGGMLPISILSANTQSVQSIPSKSLVNAFTKATQEIHQQVERHQFVKSFLKKTLLLEHYGQYLVDSRSFYQVLEEEIRLNLQKDRRLQQIHVPKLDRYPGLTKDLNKVPEIIRARFKASQAAEEYVKHLKHLGKNKPILLAAHSYIHNLANLSGGTILERKTKENWSHVPRYFYDFSSLMEKKTKREIIIFKEEYKARFENLNIDEETFDQLVKEAVLAFKYAERIFTAIIPVKQEQILPAHDLLLKV